jgi:hypothetical protein
MASNPLFYQCLLGALVLICLLLHVGLSDNPPRVPHAPLEPVQSKYLNPLFSHSLQPNRCLRRTLNLTLTWLILNTMYGVMAEVK